MDSRKDKYMQLYLDYKYGDKFKRINELKEKRENETITQEEFKELKSMERIEANIPKVSNILVFKQKLISDKNKLKDELKRREDLESATKETEELEAELEKILNEKTEIEKQLKNPELKEDERLKLEEKNKEIIAKRTENNEKFKANQDKFKNTNVDEELSKMFKEDIENQMYETSSKISKCNMIVNNLMKGYSWNSIEVALDNWKDRKLTSTEKIQNKIITKNEQQKNEVVMSRKEKVQKFTENLMHTLKEDERIENSPKDEALIQEQQDNFKFKKNDKDYMDEILLPGKSKEKTGLWGKIKNFFKGIKKRFSNDNNVKKIEASKEPQKVEAKFPQKDEIKEEIPEVKEIKEIKETVTDNNQDFKAYIKEIADKGLNGIEAEKQAKLEAEQKAKEEAEIWERFHKEIEAKAKAKQEAMAKAKKRADLMNKKAEMYKSAQKRDDLYYKVDKDLKQRRKEGLNNNTIEEEKDAER